MASEQEDLGVEIGGGAAGVSVPAMAEMGVAGVAAHSAPEMVELSLANLEEDPENARLHGDKNLVAIKASLREYGQVEPLIVQSSTMRVIGGNGRLRAMREMGWTSARVALIDIDDLRARTLALALNRTAELAEWDFEKISVLVREVQGMNIDTTNLLAGWDEHELAPLLAADWNPPTLKGDLSKDFTPEKNDNEPVIKLSVPQRRVFDAVAAEIRAADGQGYTDGEVVEVLCRVYGSAGL
jgi:ParB-like chromosome segregation protein Spo0J